MTELPIDPDECECKDYWYNNRLRSWLSPKPFHVATSPGYIFCPRCYTLRTKDGKVIHLKEATK